MSNDSVKVAFQGEPGAFSEQAARALVAANITLIAHRTFDEMFEAVQAKEVDCAVAPIENSLAGSVVRNYELLARHELTIVGETRLRIVHNLIALPGVELRRVARVYSHPVAIAQCERFLSANPQIEIVPAYDTAGSVKMIVERDAGDEAAIASREAAARYGAEIIAEGIEDNPENYTRFLLLTRPDCAEAIKTRATEGGRKTSIAFRFANRPGGLFRALAAFALRDIDLTKIESRPIEGRPWEYLFYLDFVGDIREPKVERALAHLAEMAESIRVFGTYSRTED